MQLSAPNICIGRCQSSVKLNLSEKRSTFVLQIKAEFHSKPYVIRDMDMCAFVHNLLSVTTIRGYNFVPPPHTQVNTTFTVTYLLCWYKYL